MSGRASLPEVLDLAITGALARVRVMLPGEIKAYDATTQRADVQLLVQDRRRTPDNTHEAITIATLTDVPVQFPGFGANRITFPIRKGMRVMVGFSSSAIAKLKGGARGVVNPGDDRHHDLADGIIFAGFETDPPTAAPTDAIEIHSEGEIRCGGDQPLVTREEFLKHTHATAGTGTPSPPIPHLTGGSALSFPGTEKLRG